MGMEARESVRSMESAENVDAYLYSDVRFCHFSAALNGGEDQSRAIQ